MVITFHFLGLAFDAFGAAFAAPSGADFALAFARLFCRVAEAFAFGMYGLQRVQHRGRLVAGVVGAGMKPCWGAHPRLIRPSKLTDSTALKPRYKI